jgi:hypothetical protein
MTWLKNHWLGVLSVALSAASLLAGVGLGHRWPAAAPTLAVPAQLAAGPGDLVKVPATSNGAALLWDVRPPLPSFALDAERALLVSAKAAGRYTVTCETAKGSRIARAACVLTVGQAPPPGPGPTPPVPPGPPAPIPADGLHVLVVIDGARLTAAQADALDGQAVRGYLNATCPAGPDGKTKEWRVWDRGVDPANESKLWQDAFARTKGKPLPYVVISNGKTGFEGPLPESADALLALLKKYGSPGKAMGCSCAGGCWCGGSYSGYDCGCGGRGK